MEGCSAEIHTIECSNLSSTVAPRSQDKTLHPTSDHVPTHEQILTCDLVFGVGMTLLKRRYDQCQPTNIMDPNGCQWVGVNGLAAGCVYTNTTLTTAQIIADHWEETHQSSINKPFNPLIKPLIIHPLYLKVKTLQIA